MKFREFFFCVLSVVALDAYAQARSGRSGGSSLPTGSIDQANALMNAFASACPASNGAWTQAASQAALQLSNTLKSIQNDEACKSLSAAISSQVNILQNNIQRVQEDPFEVSIAGLRRQQYDLLMMISSAPSASVQAELEDKLRNVQIESESLQAKSETYNQNYRDRLTAATLVNSVEALLQQATLQRECMIQRPEILAGVLGLAGSVGAAMATGGSSIVVGAGTELLSLTVEFARRSSLAKAMNKISEARIHDSYICVIEALSNQWCAADETERLLERRAQALKSRSLVSQTIRLLDVDLPNFSDWLTGVRAGTSPTDEREAARQIEADLKEAALNAFETSLKGEIGKVKARLPEGNSEQELSIRFRLIQKTIVKIREILGANAAYYTTGASNPILDIVSLEEFPWIVIGVSPAPTDNINGEEKVLDFAGMNESVFKSKYLSLYPLDPDVVLRRSLFLISQGRSRLNQERTRIKQVDAWIPILDAEEPRYVGNIRGVSPLSSVSRIRNFISEVLEQEKNITASRKKVYSDTQERLDDIVEAIQKALRPESRNTLIVSEDNVPSSPAAEALSSIYQKAELQYGTSFFEGRLRRILRTSLNEELLAKVESKELSAQLLASQDILEEFQSLGRSGSSVLVSDLDGARINSETTLQAFAEVFADNLNLSLRFYANKAKETASSRVKASYKRRHAQVCLSLLSIPRWDAKALRKVDLSSCEGVVRESSVYSNEGSQPIQLSDYKIPFGHERACRLRNFFREERIRDIFENR